MVFHGRRNGFRYSGIRLGHVCGNAPPSDFVLGIFTHCRVDFLLRNHIVQLDGPRVRVDVEFLCFRPFVGVIVVANVQQDVHIAAFLESDDSAIPLVDARGIQFFVRRIGDSFQIDSG